ncbi:MAG: hypothetical protein R3A45_13160 [Bdellovibrionota bacterium]
MSISQIQKHEAQIWFNITQEEAIQSDHTDHGVGIYFHVYCRCGLPANHQAFRQKPDPQLYEVAFLQNISTFIKNLLTPKISNHADREELAQEILLSIHKIMHTYDDSKAFQYGFTLLYALKPLIIGEPL